MCEKCEQRKLYMAASDKVACDEVSEHGIVEGSRVMVLMAVHTIYGRVACAEDRPVEERKRAIIAVHKKMVEALETLRDQAFEFTDNLQPQGSEPSVSLH